MNLAAVSDDATMFDDEPAWYITKECCICNDDTNIAFNADYPMGMTLETLKDQPQPYRLLAAQGLVQESIRVLPHLVIVLL